MVSSLAGTQMPFAQAQTTEEEEDNQEGQQSIGTVNVTETETAGNETILDNGNSGQEEDADIS